MTKIVYRTLSGQEFKTLEDLKAYFGDRFRTAIWEAVEVDEDGIEV